MASLSRELRRQLENTVKAARKAAETGAKKALETLAVSHSEHWSNMSVDKRALRNRLRAHGRQLGDRLDTSKGTQSIRRLTSEVAYEHWHRMLFARFLAENELLIEPEVQIAISMDEVRELARDQSVGWIDLASSYAQRMLPQIFREGDPALEVNLPPETRQELEESLESLPAEIFRADDSLGWVYQFWQADRKDEVNASGIKIGADELPAVTQLFTEDYMVDFLLDNTLGAWWAGRKLAANQTLAETATTEDELREAVSLPGASWSFLRFVKDDDGRWTPAAGTFDAWPKTAKEITCLDPCMGSGHFIVAIFQRMVAMRRAEEGVDESRAVWGVISENIFGLEIDPRCTQIAAFNLALAAWRRVGYIALPPLTLACSGVGVGPKEEEWLQIAGDDPNCKETLKYLQSLFQHAPLLGSLIDPRRSGGDLFIAAFDRVRPRLQQVIEHEGASAVAVAARGIIAAAAILTRSFTLIGTNVPYLGRGKQSPLLAEYSATYHPSASSNLATCFIERSLRSSTHAGTVAVVGPHSWLYLKRYSEFRKRRLSDCTWNYVAVLGARGFSTPMFDLGIMLTILSNQQANAAHRFILASVEAETSIDEKIGALLEAVQRPLKQSEQLKNPEAIITQLDLVRQNLGGVADTAQGIITGDNNRFILRFWECDVQDPRWEWLIEPPTTSTLFGGRTSVIRWDGGNGALHHDSSAHNFPAARIISKRGIALQRMPPFRATLYEREIFGDHIAPLVTEDDSLIPALWCYCTSEDFVRYLREIDSAMKVSVGAFLKVPFDEGYWRQRALKEFPGAMPAPGSDSPDQWLFHGDPRKSGRPLHAIMARILGYRWPRQQGLRVNRGLRTDSADIEPFGASDGIVCTAPVRGESSGADRVRGVVATGWDDTTVGRQVSRLLAEEPETEASLETWVRDRFFSGHLQLFGHRPFLWHVWDGERDGFGVLLNYHRLAAPNGAGRKALETVVYSYLGDWISRQRSDQKNGVEGSDVRLAAAEHLKAELEKILHGEPPYDIFVRWKPLNEQPIGWEPDINDGVRINIRPFMTAKPFRARGKNGCILRVTPGIHWKKDRGNEPVRPKEDYPWFWGWDGESQNFMGGSKFDGSRWNDLHYSRAVKEAARERHAAATGQKRK